MAGASGGSRVIVRTARFGKVATCRKAVHGTPSGRGCRARFGKVAKGWQNAINLY
jgi:hypothetical protein